MNVIYGPISARQFATYDPDTSSWKMWPDTGLWGSIAYSETWPKTGCMCGGQAYELPTLVPHTTASAYSFLRVFPTPKASDGIMGRPRTRGRPIEKSTHLGTIVTLLPTPRAADHQATMGAPGAQRHVEKGQRLPGRNHWGVDVDYFHGVGCAEHTTVDGDRQAFSGFDWGKYEPAIRRWEALTRPAPCPVEMNRNDRTRLSAAFSEWMMGLPAGHVTGVPGLSRAAQLKAIGNGVCPQQATAALEQLLTMMGYGHYDEEGL